MSPIPLYDTWFVRLQQLHPQMRRTQIRMMAWLIVGIYLSKSVHLSKIASKMSGLAKLPSKVRRMVRFLDNGRVHVRPWYDPIARQILIEAVEKRSELIIAVDGTKIGFGHQLLMVGLAYRKRTLPLAWTWCRHKKGHSTAHKQLALLDTVKQMVPKNCTIILVGDSEFGSGEVLKQLKKWHWGFVLRQQPNWLVEETQNEWLRLDALVTKSGQRRWLPNTRLTGKHRTEVNVLAYWRKGEKKPWLLATSLSTWQETLRCYRRRMWIEEMFGDFKKHGFDIESTHLRHFLRLSRLTLAVSLLYVSLMTEGAYTIKNGLRHLVDHKSRRDFSIFRIGCNMLERCLNNELNFRLRFVPYF
ncbi:IS4 family transposase [bacterium]|nr:IS4 family transposase [bacterium]